MSNCPAVSEENPDITGFDRHVHMRSGASFASVLMHISVSLYLVENHHLILALRSLRNPILCLQLVIVFPPQTPR